MDLHDLDAICETWLLPLPEEKQVMNGPVNVRQILGVRFLVEDAQSAVDVVTDHGGLVVVPSGPGLSSLSRDERYRRALLGADFAIADSSLMVMLWNFIKGDHIQKLSGLKYMKKLIEQPHFKEPGVCFWVMPSLGSSQRNRRWLSKRGIELADDDIYVAPIYGTEFNDPELICRIEQRHPRHIILGVGSGTQEPLGYYLKGKLSYCPTIHCIGAAIAFLSGDQVKIPAVIDRLGLGWFWRCLSNPRRYVPRYWDAKGLILLMFRYRDQMPPANQ